MALFNKGKIKINFEFGEIDGRFMNIHVINNNNEEFITPESPVYESQVILPTKIIIKTSGKNMKYDTKIVNNEIVADMYAKITDVTLDSHPLNHNFHHKKINLKAEDGRVHTTNYFGFNGTVEITLQEDNIFSQYLILNSDA